MNLIRSEVDIAASPQTVWAMLTDFGSFSQWNPFIERAEGRLEQGSTITVQLRIYRRRPTVFHPRVTRVIPGVELRWQATTGRPGVFDVERLFVIEPLQEGGVRFHQSEVCSGVLAPALMATGLAGKIKAGYERFNTAIKTRAEAVERSAQTPAAPATALP